VALLQVNSFARQTTGTTASKAVVVDIVYSYCELLHVCVYVEKLCVILKETVRDCLIQSFFMRLSNRNWLRNLLSLSLSHSL